MCVLALVSNCMVRPHTLYDRTVFAMSLVERRMVLADLFEQRIDPVVVRPTKPTSVGQLKLMFCHAPRLTAPEIQPFSVLHRKAMKSEKLEVAALLFVLDDLDEMRRRAFHWPENRCRGICYAAHAGLVTLPRAAAHRIASLSRRDSAGEQKKGDAK